MLGDLGKSMNFIYRNRDPQRFTGNIKEIINGMAQNNFSNPGDKMKFYSICDVMFESFKWRAGKIAEAYLEKPSSVVFLQDSEKVPDPF